MEQNKFLHKLFNQMFNITDLKNKIVEISFITKYIPTINILNSKIEIQDKYKNLSITSPTFFQKLNKQLHFIPKCTFCINNKGNI